MGRLFIVVPDELEERLREYLHRKYGYKYYGKISEIAVKALERELDRLERSETES